MTHQIAILFGLIRITLYSTMAIFTKLAYQYKVDTINILLLKMIF